MFHADGSFIVSFGIVSFGIGSSLVTHIGNISVIPLPKKERLLACPSEVDVSKTEQISATNAAASSTSQFF